MAKMRFGKKPLDKSWKHKMPRGRKYKILFLISLGVNISLIMYILLGLYNGQ